MKCSRSQRSNGGSWINQASAGVQPHQSAGVALYDRRVRGVGVDTGNLTLETKDGLGCLPPLVSGAWEYLKEIHRGSCGSGGLVED